MTTVEGHKLMFDEKIQAEFDKRKKNSRMRTRAQYESTVERLKLIENGEHRTSVDFNMIRRFGLMRVQVNDTIVEKLVQSGTDKRFVPIEDLFNVIREVHFEKGHSGRDVMKRYLKD